MKNYYNSIFVLLIFLTASCSTFQSSKDDLNESLPENSRDIASSTLESIIDKFHEHFESDISQARKLEIKTIQENLIKYLIEATNSSDSNKVKIYNDATNYFNKIYPALLSNLKNEKDGVNRFIEIKSAPLWTLKDELDYLNLEVKNLPTAKIKIDLIQGLKLFASFYEKTTPDVKGAVGDFYEESVAKALGKKYNFQPSYAEIENFIQMKGKKNDKILKVIGLVEQKLEKHKQAIRSIGSEIARSGQVDMNNTQIRLIVKFMDYYFSKLPENVINTIISEMVTAGPKMTEEMVINIVFQNTGPALGKVLQQIGKEKGVGPQFSKLMSILESNGKKVPIHLVKKVVSSDLGGFEIKAIDEKPLGTGTVAQVSRAILIDDEIEKEVALRYLKPGVKERSKEDILILRQFIPDNEAALLDEGIDDLKIIETLVDGVEKFLDEEMDLEISVERQKKAFEIYSRSVKIEADPKYKMLEMKVPDVYLAPNGKSNLHIQEFVTGGAKFSELTDEKAKKFVAEEMLRMWFEEALFKSGFLNADMHQGNFRVVLAEDNEKIKVLLYDFGLTTTLSKEDQRAFILLGAGAHLKSPGTLTDGLMASINSKDPDLRARLLADIKNEMKLNPDKSAEKWVAWCVQKKYFVSDKLGAFSRGSLLLKQLPESLGDTEMFKNIVIKNASTNLAHSIADRDYDYPLNKIDLIKIGAIQMKNSCMELLKAFYQ